MNSLTLYSVQEPAGGKVAGNKEISLKLTTERKYFWWESESILSI